MVYMFLVDYVSEFPGLYPTNVKTIATYGDSVPAKPARGRLQDAGIRVYLADELAAGMAWHLTNAVGGIKLQFADEDVEKATAVLAGEAGDDFEDNAPNQPFADPSIEAEAALDQTLAVEEEEPGPNRREQIADRALRGAIFSIFVLPLQLYVFWLLLNVFISNEPLRRPHLRHAIVAAVINLPIVVGFLFAAREWLPRFS
jgi:hypothetical protein